MIIKPAATVKSIKIATLIAFTFLISLSIQAQRTNAGSSKNIPVYVDKDGIMRWSKDNTAVSLFGVNYTVPFAYSYRALNDLGISHEKAIDEDVYHFARLGFDAFRVHVWDCEISDTMGNLLDNDHLRLFDYLLKKLEERGIKIIITPIAYWGDGYPEPDQKTPGFSTKYGKEKCLTDSNAIRAQERYLFQFINHVNVYTGISYKDDPDIIAFEVCNEPHHKGTLEETTNFINLMVKAIRNTGCKKPVFYNISHSINLADAYFNANIQGGTFQWYPTGLVSGHEQKGNYLPNVNKYPIPYTDDPKFSKMARMVYEFDAADIGGSYMYPYMAKSFRETGFQFATQFAYDPMELAYANTEYTTHYVNLAFAPKKALSLKIAGEAFHKLPTGKKFGGYPNDSVFDVFRVSYKNDLSEMVTYEKFMYSNSTATVPPAPGKLKEIAGYGNSSVVQYPGCGAYFLDKLEDGVWRLELMPDDMWVRDPFERASPRKEVSVIIWNKWPMTIDLPDLGDQFTFTALNKGNGRSGEAVNKTMEITPGTYLIIRKGKATKWKGDDKWRNITLDEFAAPSTTCKKTYVLHKPPEEVTAGQPVSIEVKVVTPVAPDSVMLYVFGRRWRPDRIIMRKTKAYTYTAEIDSNLVKEGFLDYYITLAQNEKYYTYPSGNEGKPGDWDFYDLYPYSIKVVNPSFPLCLFNAENDSRRIVGSRSFFSFKTIPSADNCGTDLKVNVGNLDTEEHDFSFKFFFGDKIKARHNDLNSCNEIVLHGNSLSGKSFPVQIALVMDDGIAYGGTVMLQPDKDEYILLIRDLKKVKTVDLPEAYPVFMPYYFENNSDEPFNINRIENLQISVGPGIPESEYAQAHVFILKNVILK